MQAMKIAVTALGESPESPIDQRFGRARYFILCDAESGQWSARSNRQNLEAAQGAGVQAAQHVMNLGAKAVITGHCGPKAFATLMAGGVDVYQEASGSVQEAVEKFRAGLLSKSKGADVEAGYGSV
jgi:predicted Fe-Mo cluster-binding NifX family protein